MKSLLKALVVLSMLAMLTLFASAGVYIEQKNHTDAAIIMGQNQPARDILKKTWMETDKMRTESGDQMTIILRLDQKKIYFIDSAKKSYSFSDLPLKFPPEMEQMLNAFQFKVDVQKTGEKKQVGSYSCEKVLMKMSGFMNFTYTMWCTPDIKLPYSNYYTMTAQMLSYAPAMKELMEQMRNKLSDMFPVEQEVSGEVMGTKTHATTNLIKIDTSAIIPADKFEPPAGYTKEELDFMKLMQQRQ